MKTEHRAAAADKKIDSTLATLARAGHNHGMTRPNQTDSDFTFPIRAIAERVGLCPSMIARHCLRGSIGRKFYSEALGTSYWLLSGTCLAWLMDPANRKIGRPPQAKKILQNQD